MKRLMVKVLCLVVLGAGAGWGCGDEEPPTTGKTTTPPPPPIQGNNEEKTEKLIGEEPDDDPEATALSLQLSESTAMVVPAVDNTGLIATFTATISGFDNAFDAETVRLKIDSVSGLEISPNSGEMVGNSKTFVVNVQHNSQKLTDCEAKLSVGLSSVPMGYKYREGPKTVTVAIRGATKNCRIEVNSKNVKAFNSYANTSHGLKLHYALIEDIQLEPPVAPESSNWTAIGTCCSVTSPFIGSFDGRNNTLSGLVISRPTSSYQGLFGHIGNNNTTGQYAEIENLGLIDANVEGNNEVGALVGRASHAKKTEGTEHFAVQNCYVNGESQVKGAQSVGGIVGYLVNGGSQVQNIYSEAEVEGTLYVGGVVGRASSSVKNCYSTGNVTGGNRTGGVVGENSAAVTSCYATGEVFTRGLSGNDKYYVGGVAAYGAANITNCLALNLDVRSTNTGSQNNFIMRIGYMNGGQAQNVQAFAGLLADDSKLSRNLMQLSTGRSDGADVSAEALNNGNGIPGDFKKLPWTYAAGSLPGLFGKTVDMPEHILDAL